MQVMTELYMPLYIIWRLRSGCLNIFMTSDLFIMIVIIVISYQLILLNTFVWWSANISSIFSGSFLFRFLLYVFVIFYWKCVICVAFLSSSSVFNMKVWSLNALTVYFIFYWKCGICFSFSSRSYSVWKSSHWMQIASRHFYDITKALFTSSRPDRETLNQVWNMTQRSEWRLS